ncbi:hypothetical protein DNH61_17270 [Paenibacillus sambharensis]|uniref:Phage tail protein n=1 Tax=Paenibacillus sambharensis TaxID=1803190 RepID=A0A2W1L988_9BACL|nr:hypothetical protein [Paenibacillus sambharensis]PZD94700.1 hypothetical protein DNH61_17270 [Paenibacillus sambharensis]
MTEQPRHRLLVKHVTGRVLLDTGKTGESFTIHDGNGDTRLGEGEGSWKIRVTGVPTAVATEIIRLRDELNLFHFIEQPDAEPPVRKWWMYGKRRHPEIMENASAAELQITVDARAAYSNDAV